MKRTIKILLIAAIHFVVTVGLAMATFEISGFMFGVYPKPNTGALHSILITLRTVLMFPLGSVAESLGPKLSLLGWPLVVINSLLWAVVLYMLVGRLLRSRKRKAADDMMNA